MGLIYHLSWPSSRDTGNWEAVKLDTFPGKYTHTLSGPQNTWGDFHLIEIS